MPALLLAPGPVRRVLMLAVSPVQPLDLFGPLEVFRGANLVKSGSPPYAIEVVSWRQRIITTDAEIPLGADRVAPFPPRAVDTFVVVGGEGARTTVDPHLDAWVQRMAAMARRTISICTGAFVLARAGLLDGRVATTHWLFASDLARAFPRVTVEPDRIWVEDGPIFTSAGVSTGMDLALALVARDLGRATSLQVARALILFVQRTGKQAQFSPVLAAQRAESRSIGELQAWLVEHLGEPHTVESLADRAAMSPRNFSRVFARAVGCPPARFLARLRVEAARRWLEESERSVEEIAELVGFAGADVMTRAFRREMDTTPIQWRAQCRGR